MSKNVTIEDLHIAADWLDINNGEAGEKESCQRVREMLLRMIEQREKDIIARKISQKLGISEKQVRQTKTWNETIQNLLKDK